MFGCYLRDDIRLYFLYHNSAAGYYRVCSCLEMLPKFKMAARGQLVGAKTPKLEVGNYSNFTITFPMIWRCADDFFKVLLKFKMAATDQL